MSTDTYIGILFSVVITFVFSHFFGKIKKEFIKILIPIIFIFIATIIYKFNDLTLYIPEIISSFSKCIPFFFKNLLNIVADNNYKSILLPSFYVGTIINFLIEYSTDKQFFYKDLSFVFSFLGVIIYIIITGLFFIWAYYLLYNTNLHIISYIVFIIIFISPFYDKYILFFLLSIQRKIQN